MMKDTILKILGKSLYLWCYVRWCMRISLPQTKLKPAILAILGLVSAIIEIGGFDMASFWSGFFGDLYIPWINIYFIINIIVILLLVYWYYGSERENKKWKADCQWLFDENDKLRKLVGKFMPKPKPAHLELSADIILERTTPEEAKRGEIHKHLSEK